MEDNPGPSGTVALCDRFTEVPAASHSSVAPAHAYVRLTAQHGPYGDVQKEWNDRHAYACEGGNRASLPADGCSAGTSAYSSFNSEV